ncbi:MAG: tryptophan--tRNA ligase, partial [Planctomycetaceae bacterium]
EKAMEHFAAARDRREQLAADPDTLEDILRTGAETARAKCAEVFDRARAACGLSPRTIKR